MAESGSSRSPQDPKTAAAEAAENSERKRLRSMPSSVPEFAEQICRPGFHRRRRSHAAGVRRTIAADEPRRRVHRLVRLGRSIDPSRSCITAGRHDTAPVARHAIRTTRPSSSKRWEIRAGAAGRADGAAAASKSRRDGPMPAQVNGLGAGHAQDYFGSPKGATRDFARGPTSGHETMSTSDTMGPMGPPRWGWACFTVLPAPGRWPGLAWGCHVVAEDATRLLAIPIGSANRDAPGCTSPVSSIVGPVLPTGRT